MADKPTRTFAKLDEVDPLKLLIHDNDQISKFIDFFVEGISESGKADKELVDWVEHALQGARTEVHLKRFFSMLGLGEDLDKILDIVQGTESDAH